MNKDCILEENKNTNDSTLLTNVHRASADTNADFAVVLDTNDSAVVLDTNDSAVVLSSTPSDSPRDTLAGATRRKKGWMDMHVT